MENEEIIVPVSISIRGTWKKQITGMEPDFTGLKFTVKYSDKSTQKYADFQEFSDAGGDYLINIGKKWLLNEGLQSIRFFLTDTEVSLIKEVNVVSYPVKLDVISQTKVFQSGDDITSNFFNFGIRYQNNDYKKVIPEGGVIIITPNVLPLDADKEYECDFIYEEDGVSVSAKYSVKVELRRYRIKITTDSSKGSGSILVGGKPKTEAYYTYNPYESTVFSLSAKPYTDYYGFTRWFYETKGYEITPDYKSEALLTIPAEFVGDIDILAIWGSRYTDKYRNTYTIEDGKLIGVKLLPGGAGDVSIPSIVKIIGKEVFKNLEIRSLVIPEGVEYIEESAFEGCSLLKELNIPSSVKEIGKSAFEGCSSIKSIKFNQVIPFVIRNKAFSGCSSLYEVDFLSLQNKFKDCIFGDGERLDVWEGCNIGKVRLTKGNFASITGMRYSDSLITVRPSYAMKVVVKSRKGNVKIKSIGVSSKSSCEDISQNMDRRSVYTKEYNSKEQTSVVKIENYLKGMDYDCRESCGFGIKPEDSSVWIETLGMGHSSYNYEVYAGVYSDYRFTPCGSDSQIKIGEMIGQGFENWNMRDNVNNLLYPNIKFEVLSDKMFEEKVKMEDKDLCKVGGSLIDLMLPLYNRRKF